MVDRELRAFLDVSLDILNSSTLLVRDHGPPRFRSLPVPKLRSSHDLKVGVTFELTADGGGHRSAPGGSAADPGRPAAWRTASGLTSSERCQPQPGSAQAYRALRDRPNFIPRTTFPTTLQLPLDSQKRKSPAHAHEPNPMARGTQTWSGARDGATFEPVARRRLHRGPDVPARGEFQKVIDMNWSGRGDGPGLAPGRAQFIGRNSGPSAGRRNAGGLAKRASTFWEGATESIGRPAGFA